MFELQQQLRPDQRDQRAANGADSERDGQEYRQQDQQQEKTIAAMTKFIE